jgi:hypothetical protein
MALKLLETAPGPRTTVRNPLVWPGPPGWRRVYLGLDGLTPEDLARERRANDAIKDIAQGVRDAIFANRG